jgi:hypothetical protein
MTSASLIIVGFGLLTAVTLSFFDFHRPYGLSELRHAAMRERYWLAVSGYASVGLTAYVVLIAAVAASIFYFQQSTELDERGRPYAIGAAIAVFFLSWVGRLPVLGAICGTVRTTLQTLVARYPQSTQTASAIIARAEFEPSPQARDDLRTELGRYALPQKLVDAALEANDRYLSAAVTRVLLEVCSLRAGFELARNEEKFAGFFAGRERTCASIEQEHHHLLRRVARALFVFEDLKVPDASTEELALELSEFLSEECDALKARYHKLLAELVLSALNTQEARRRLLKNFGYTVELATSVPFWPVVAVFAVYLFFPVVIMIFAGSGDNKMTTYAAGLVAFAQSWAVAIAVFLAVFPKETDFGRPTLFSLPWRSYLLYGAISYIVGAAIQYASYKAGGVFDIFRLPDDYPAHAAPFSTSLLVATICVYFTVGQSILIDRRIRSGSLDYHKGRLADALWFTGPMIVLVAALQVAFYVVPHRAPPFTVTELTVMSIAYLLIVFMMGFFVPSTSHAHLEATKIILAGQTSVKPMSWTLGASQSPRPLSVASSDSR